MFDRVVVAKSEHHHSHSHRTEVVEKRAPTDESVRLLAEMEAAARARVLQSIRLRDCPMDAVLQIEQLPEKDEMLCRIVAKLGGRQLVVEHVVSRETEDPLVRLRDAVAESIAHEILDLALPQIVRAIGDFWSR